MEWIIIVWFLVGIITVAWEVFENVIKGEERIDFEAGLFIFMWLLIGPIMWLGIGIYELEELWRNSRWRK